MKIEVATVASKEVVEALQNLIPQLTGKESHITSEYVKAIIKEANTYLLLAYGDNDHILGTLTLVVFTIPASKKAFIEDVVVDEKAQGMGLGQKLVEAGIDLAKSKGVTRIELSSSPTRIAANALYQKVGFKVRDTNFYRLEF